MSLRTEVARRIDPATYQTIPNLQASLSRLGNTVQYLNESIASLQQIAREDRDWIYISQQAYGQLIDRRFLNEIILNARYYRVKNPIVNRAVTLHSHYVYGRGVEIRIADEKTADSALQEFIEANPAMQVLGLTELDDSLQTDGNVFLALFTDEIRGPVKVRKIDALNITDIICNPNDVEEPWFYRREWNQRIMNPLDGSTQEVPRIEWYPALGYAPASKIPTIAGSMVNWSTPILHEKIGCLPGSKFGLPAVFAALDPSSAYRKFIESWSILQDVYRRIALDIETKGGQKVVDSVKDTLNTTLGIDMSETNPTPQTGSTFIHGPGAKITALKTAGATTSPDEAQALMRYAIMTLWFPETFFGNADVGNHATAKTLDRPTELAILHSQQVAKRMIERVCEYAVAQQKRAPGGSLRQLQGIMAGPRVLVSFPPVLEHDVPALIGAAVDAATLKGQTLAGTVDPRTLSALLLGLLGIEDVQDILDAMYPEGSYDPAAWRIETPEERRAAAEELAARASSAGVTERAQLTSAAALADVTAKLLESVRG